MIIGELDNSEFSAQLDMEKIMACFSSKHFTPISFWYAIGNIEKLKLQFNLCGLKKQVKQPGIWIAASHVTTVTQKWQP